MANPEEQEEFEFVPVDKPITDDDDNDDDNDDEQNEQEDEAPVISEEEDAEGDDDEREKIRERRRKERKERKKRRDEAIKRDHTELNFLRERNEDLEKRLTSIEKRGQTQENQTLKQQYDAAVQEAQTAERIIAKAVEAGEGEDVTKAMRYRDEALNRARQLGWNLNQRSQAQKNPPKKQQQQQPAPNPEIARRAQKFIEKHSWYNPKSGDEDSAIVLAIDQAVTREGYDPTSDDYWEELEDRMERRLPNRFGKKEKNKGGGPRLGSGKEHAPSSTRKEVYISPERKQALVDAGVWDDPVLRNKYIKRYMEYDKTHK